MFQPELIDAPISWEQLGNLHTDLDKADDRQNTAKEELKEAKAAYKKASDKLRAAGRRVRATALAERNRTMNRHLSGRHTDPDTGEILPG